MAWCKESRFTARPVFGPGLPAEQNPPSFASSDEWFEHSHEIAGPGPFSCHPPTHRPLLAFVNHMNSSFQKTAEPNISAVASSYGDITIESLAG